MQEGKHRNPQLKVNKAFSRNDSVFGLPLPLFLFGVLLSVTGAALLIGYLGLLFGGGLSIAFSLTIFVPLKWIHKDDVHAWVLWLEAMRTPFLSPDFTQKKEVFLLNGKQVMSFKKWRNRNYG